MKLIGPVLAVAAWVLVGCAAPGSVDAPVSAPVVAASASLVPTATPVFVPNAETYFPRIARFDFPTAPSSFITALARSVGSSSARRSFVSYAGRSVVQDGVQLPVLVAVMVIVPELYARADTFSKLAEATLTDLPGSIGRPLVIGSLALPGVEITLPEAKGYAVTYQQGFFFVQVIGSDPKLLLQMAEVLIEANSRRQP